MADNDAIHTLFHKMSEDEALAYIVEHMEGNIKRNFSRHEAAQWDSTMLALAGHNSVDVRCAVAWLQPISHDTQSKLALDFNPYVKAMLAANCDIAIDCQYGHKSS